ncbi:hypothetical protein BC826DRAFT_524222 [Russula brevipes]|nr:hypothetical protein BC826DRAFT_524222 [Russula brevipes]
MPDRRSSYEWSIRTNARRHRMYHKKGVSLLLRDSCACAHGTCYRYAASAMEVWQLTFPQTIVYVSCNVHTQAGTLGRSSWSADEVTEGKGEGKYVLKSLRGFDSFPQTGRVDSHSPTLLPTSCLSLAPSASSVWRLLSPSFHDSCPLPPSSLSFDRLCHSSNRLPPSSVAGMSV